MDNFDYKKYSLENLEKWIENAINSSGASPQEIYDVIKKVVEENYYCYKNHTGRSYELLALLNGNGYGHLSCYKDNKSTKSKKSRNDYMPPWGHSDMESLQYTEEELDAMCDAAEKKDKALKWNLSVEFDSVNGDYYIQFPDDLMKAADIKEDDLVEWIDRGDGSFELRKVTKPIKMEEY